MARPIPAAAPDATTTLPEKSRCIYLGSKKKTRPAPWSDRARSLFRPYFRNCLAFSAVMFEQSHDDVEEGRFARAIAAAQRVDGARTEGERARDKRRNPVERLADILSPQKEICHDLASQKLLLEHGG